MKIPVVFATDQNYLFFTCVAITSMAQNAKSHTLYQIYILTAPDFSDPDNLLNKLQKRYCNIQIGIIQVDEKLFQNVTIHNTHITKATYYRLVLCDLLKEERCIYLDGDIIVTEDLEELYQTDLGNKYLAGCRDIWIDMLSEEEKEIRRKRTEIPSMDQYVNAGVLLLNLEQIRADGMNHIFVEHLQYDYLFEDQDILNVCCYGKIVRLPAKWNLFTVFMGQISRMQKAGVDQDTLHAFQEKKGIIHYATPMIRPWKKRYCWMNEEWWSAAAIWSEESVFKYIKGHIDQYECENSWDYYGKLCSNYEHIIVFGYTKYSKQLCEWIKNMKPESELVFCDNDFEKQGQNYNGISVISFQEAEKWRKKKELNSVLFLIASQVKYEEIRKLLTEHGVSEKEIVCYRCKNRDYYLFLDERYYKNELQDICKRECIDWDEFSPLNLEEIRMKLTEDKAYRDWMEGYYLDNWLLKERKNG